MPTYEYKCRDCGQTFEVVQSFTDDPLTDCPTCEGSLKKVFAAPGISFKGDGFYKTDSRSGSDKAGSSSSANGESTSGSDSSKKESSSTDKAATKDSSMKDKPAKSDAKASTSS